MKRSINQNGITLIALIITIIVMLILVAVTINVALNGDLFKQAKSASEETQKQADKEILYSAVAGSIDATGELNADNLETNVENIGFDITGDDFPYTCESPKGNIFYIDKNGNIKDKLDTLSSLNEIDENKLYKVTFKAIDLSSLSELNLTNNMYMFATFDANNSVIGVMAIQVYNGNMGAVVGDRRNKSI